MLGRVREIRANSPVLRMLITRDTKVRYADSVLGYVWSFLDPLLMAGVFWFVFEIILDRSVGQDPYILFLLSGMLAWNWASASIGDSPSALTKDSRLVGAVRLPREMWPLRVVLSKGVEFLLSLPILVIVALVFKHPPSLYILAFPLAMLIQLVLLVGIALILSPLGVMVTDTTNIVRLVTRLGFYASPIFYGFESVPENLRFWYSLNPMAGLIDLYRATWFPEHFTGWGPVAISAGIAVVTLLIGVAVFRRLERPALKEL